jgi:predicted secreted Zn-dependent protease
LHEQGHFDITEIFARKLNKAMSAYHFNQNTYRKDLNKIYQDIIKEKDNMQDQYDHETNFSRNKEKQMEWLKKIQTMLEELKEYDNYS